VWRTRRWTLAGAADRSFGRRSRESLSPYARIPAEGGGEIDADNQKCDGAFPSLVWRERRWPAESTVDCSAWRFAEIEFHVVAKRRSATVRFSLGGSFQNGVGSEAA